MNDIGSFNGLSEDESLRFSEISTRIDSDGCSPIRFIPVPDFNKTQFTSTDEINEFESLKDSVTPSGCYGT